MRKRRLGKYGHKRTTFCPVRGCCYTSRVMITGTMDNKLSSHSTKCPKHRAELISESAKKAIENEGRLFCLRSGCSYTQKHDDGINICPTHKIKLDQYDRITDI